MGTETTPYKPVDGEKTQAVCMRASDGSSVSAIAHYDEHGSDAGVVFTDAFNVQIDEADYEEITVGACSTNTQCAESQEWTYGIDNTGTRFNDVAAYCLELSDGSVLEWSQDGSSTSWTLQLQEWATNIQAAADSAGLQWFVEPRFVDNPNPSNIDGTINGPGGTPSGLPGAPSSAIAEALIAGGMSWRYVNFQICPGQPVPVRAYRKTSSIYTTNPCELTSAGAILGPVNKFWLCAECGREPVWYLEDGATLATAGQIPNCWEPCGTLALGDAPPDRACKFFFTTACDNNNETDILLFTQDVIRRTTVCNGEIQGIDYLRADPDDATSIEPYTLVGSFVDCATGLPIPDVVPPCNDFVSLGKMWQIDVPDTVGTLVEWWADPNGPMAGTAVGHDSVSNIFTLNNGTMEHVSGPADFSYVAPTFSVEGSNAADFLTGMGGLTTAQTSGTDQSKLSGYFVLNKKALIRDGGTRTGERGGMWLDECCSGNLEVIAERTTDTTSAERGVFNNLEIPAGVHRAEAPLSDLGSWWNLTLQASFDDGDTWESLIGYDKKPVIECLQVIKCKDSGQLRNALTGEVLDPETLLCENPCASCATPWGGC